MARPDAHRVWLGYCAVEAFAFGLGWTVAPIFFIRELGLSPLELVLAGTALELAYFAFEIPTGIDTAPSTASGRSSSPSPAPSRIEARMPSSA